MRLEQSRERSEEVRADSRRLKALPEHTELDKPVVAGVCGIV